MNQVLEPSNQYQELIKEYNNTKEANVQIDILKEIAIKGKQTKPQLTKNLNHAYRTISMTLLRDGEKNIKYRLFRHSKTITVNGIEQKQYSLTKRAFPILVLCKYKDNEKNRVDGIVDKPYLNVDEFLKFISIFEKEHNSIISHDSKKHKISLYPYISLYLTSNPYNIDQISSNFKTDKILQKMFSSIKSDEVELEKLNQKIIQLKEKISVKKYEISKILSDTLIK